jgi:hypothetical protein
LFAHQRMQKGLAVNIELVRGLHRGLLTGIRFGRNDWKIPNSNTQNSGKFQIPSFKKTPVLRLRLEFGF